VGELHRPPERTTTSRARWATTRRSSTSRRSLRLRLRRLLGFNEGSGEDTGCLNSFASLNCDRAYAITTPTNNARSHNLPGRPERAAGDPALARQHRRRRHRGLGGIMTSSIVRDISAAGDIRKNLQSPQIYQVGLQASYLGFTLGRELPDGHHLVLYIPIGRGAKPMEQWFVGGSYTMARHRRRERLLGQLRAAPGRDRGDPGTAASSATTTRPGRSAACSAAGHLGRRQLPPGAPGLDLIAEWTHHETKTPGVSNNIPVGKPGRWGRQTLQYQRPRPGQRVHDRRPPGLLIRAAAADRPQLTGGGRATCRPLACGGLPGRGCRLIGRPVRNTKAS
jgi:hypothetical protein